MERIVVLVDFTEVTALAVSYAALFNNKKGISITLMHIASQEQAVNNSQLKEQVTRFGHVLSEKGINFQVHINFGDFFSIISESISSLNADLLIIGTHGISVKGSFAGSNISRLLQLIHCPALVVQLHADVPANGFTKLLVTLPGKALEYGIEKMVTDFSSVFSPVVHILGFYEENIQNEISNSATNFATALDKSGFKTWTDLEKMPRETGFARSIVEYSDIEEIDVIVMNADAGGASSLSTDDQENILLNRLCKPVLCL